jgi:hypothetical protein
MPHEFHLSENAFGELIKTVDELALSADLDMKQLEFTKAFPKSRKLSA